MALPNPISPDPASSESRDGAETTNAVLAIVASEPTKAWRTTELVHHLARHRVLDVLLAVAQLHRSGELERVGPATYRAPTRGPAATRLLNEQRMWG